MTVTTPLVFQPRLFSHRNEIMATTPSKVLVVAAASSDRGAVTQLIGSERYEILEAGSAADALAFLDEPIGLVISDLRLQPSSGVELLRRWHARRPTSPFIVMAEACDVALAVEAMRHGAADYITKPVNGAELLVRIDKWLEACRKEERLQELESRFDDGIDDAAPGRPHLEIPAGTSLEVLERAAVEKALEQHHGNRTHAARTLGISVRTLQRKLKAWRMPVLTLRPSAPARKHALQFSR